MGIVVPNLEPAWNPVTNYLVPHIVNNMRDPNDKNLTLLREITSKLSPFLSHLQADLRGESIDASLNFLATLAGPYYPFLALCAPKPLEVVIPGAGAPLGISSNFSVPGQKVPSATTLATRPHP